MMTGKSDTRKVDGNIWAVDKEIRNLTKIFFQLILCLINYLGDMSLLNNKLTKVTSWVKLKTHFLIRLMNLPHVTRIISANESNIRSYGFSNWNCSKCFKPCTPVKVNRRFGGTYLFYHQTQNISQSKSAWSRQLAYRMLHTGFSHSLPDPQETGDIFLSYFSWL
jgi:hypothetical protein